MASILLYGPPALLTAWQAAHPLQAPHTYQATHNLRDSPGSFDMALALALDDQPDELLMLLELVDNNGPVLGRAVKRSLLSMAVAENLPAAERARLIGLNSLPALFSSERLELSCIDPTTPERYKALLGAFGKPLEWVADEVGMATPRIVCSIINEAYLLVQEGSATKADTDLAMLRGVNYPQGPFAWAEAIGLKNVLEVLQALAALEGPERFPISRLLRQQALAAH